MKQITIIILLFIGACATKETPAIKNNNRKRMIPIDSLKIFYQNRSKRSLDSLDRNLTKKFITSGGIDVQKIFEEISKNDSSSYFYYQQYAYSLGIKGKAKEALEYLNVGAKVARDKDRYFFDKALIFAYLEPLGKRDSLYFNINKAIETNPSNAYYYAIRSQFYIEDQINDKAFSDIEKAITINGRDTSFRNLRGVLRVFYKMDYSGALDDLKEISSLNANSFNVICAKAACYVRLNQFDLGFKEIEKAIKINSKNGLIYAIRAEAKQKTGDRKGAIEDMRIGASLGDKDCLAFIQKYDKVN